MTDSQLTIRKGASSSSDPHTAARELAEALAMPDASLTLFYCSPDYDLDELGAAIKEHFGSTNVIGCTTAGEISPLGYRRGTLTGVSISSNVAKVVTGSVSDLAGFELAQGEKMTRSLMGDLEKAGERPSGRNTFGLLLVDGLSMKEEAVVSALYRAMGDIQLFGGSAGDGEAFGATYLYHDGEFRRDVALLTLVQTDLPFEVFRTQHFVPSDNKMVVTAADPARRVVTEINGEPAGREYAKMVGLEVDKLTPLIFATHPVVVKIGGDYYVRSIQKVNEDESLTFFCAIDDGLVLTVAQRVDMVQDLENSFAEVTRRIGKPQLVLGCDCISAAS